MATTLYSQRHGRIEGVVLDLKTGRPPDGCIVKIVELDVTAFADTLGRFEFIDVPTGVYTLSFMYPGYSRSVITNQVVEEGKTTFVEAHLLKERPGADVFFIGGIEVTAVRVRELLPEEATTKTRITSAEIEHIQASSLGDVLELLPGIAISTPGLRDLKQAKLRHTETGEAAGKLASFGTQVIIDGAPLSNIANMQVYTGMLTTARSGIDLRQIPADNIEVVEVIRGIPSVRYGNLTSGVIKVQTKSDVTPPRLRYKNNPNTQEVNLGGGFNVFNSDASYNLNWARSIRDRRIEGDAFSRIALQASLENRLFEGDWLATNRLYYTRVFDEREENPIDHSRTARYNRDWTLRYTHNSDIDLVDRGRIRGVASVSYTRQNSFHQRLVSRDNAVISDRMTEGTQEGTFVGVYLLRYWVKGDVWSTYLDLNWSNLYPGRILSHNLMVGTSWRYEVNNGPGRIFNVLYPPPGRVRGDRPRSYNDVPGLLLGSFYIENEMSGRLWRDFTLTIGVRQEMYGFKGINLGGIFNHNPVFMCNNGIFLNPRINLLYRISDDIQLRVGYGKTSNAPPLFNIYPNPIYFDVVDTSAWVPNPDERFSIVTTYIYDLTNEEFQGYTQDKYEVSLDKRIGGYIGLSLTAFRNKTKGGFTSQTVPVVLFQYSRPNWPSLEGSTVKDTIFSRMTRPVNWVNIDSRGLEATLVTKEIPHINTVFSLQGSYNSTSSWQENGVTYALSGRWVDAIGADVVPFWNSTGRWSERLMFSYKFDTFVEPLGLWVTLLGEQIAWDRNRRTGLGDSLAVGYLSKSGEMVYIPDEERASPRYKEIRRVYDDHRYITEDRPQKWMWNVRITKSLFEGSRVSFFANNVFNDRAIYSVDRVRPGMSDYNFRNPSIFYGLELSLDFEDILNLPHWDDIY